MVAEGTPAHQVEHRVFDGNRPTSVLLADKLKNHGPQIAALPGVIVREHTALSSEALADAGLVGDIERRAVLLRQPREVHAAYAQCIIDDSG